MGSSGRAYLYAGAAVLLWSTVATAFKLALAEVSALGLLTAACAWSAAALLGVILLKGKGRALLRVRRKELLRAGLLGLLNPTAYYLVLFRSYELLPAQVAQPLNYTWPAALILLSLPLLKQIPRKRDFLSLGLCFAGILIVGKGGGTDRAALPPEGIALALLSALIWALYWVLDRKAQGDPEIRLFLSFAAALPVLLIGNAFFPSPSPLGSLRAMGACAYVGLFEMGLTFLLWSRALSCARRTADVGNLVYLSPLLSLLWIHFIGGEAIRPAAPAGLLVILGGILLSRLPGPGEKALEPPG